jgi:hypothetical protein
VQRLSGELKGFIKYVNKRDSGGKTHSDGLWRHVCVRLVDGKRRERWTCVSCRLREKSWISIWPTATRPFNSPNAHLLAETPVNSRPGLEP